MHQAETFVDNVRAILRLKSVSLGLQALPETMKTFLIFKGKLNTVAITHRKQLDFMY